MLLCRFVLIFAVVLCRRVGVAVQVCWCCCAGVLVLLWRCVVLCRRVDVGVLVLLCGRVGVAVEVCGIVQAC